MAFITCFYSSDRDNPAIPPCPISSITQDSDPGKPTAVVVWEAPLGMDISGDAIGATCSHVSGAQFNIGHTEVVCKPVDTRAEHEGECQFSVTIIGMYSSRTSLPSAIVIIN